MRDVATQWLTEGCCGGTRSLALHKRGRGFVRGLPAEPLDTSRRNKGQRGKEAQAGSVAEHRKREKKKNVAESGREARREEKKKDRA